MKTAFILWIIACFSVWSATLYVATDGTDGGLGTVASPLSLTKALSATSPAVPGDTILLRSGVYVGRYTNSLNGTAGQPITIRSSTNEWAILEDTQYIGEVIVYGSLLTTMRIEGSYCQFRDIEVRNPCTDRTVYRSGGVGLFGQNCLCANMVIHDCGNGVWFNSSATNSEIYGCVIYNNGYQGPDPDDGHGHGIYAQSNGPDHVIRDNILFNQFGLGIQCYASGGQLLGFDLEGNTSFNNGALQRDPRHTANYLVGGYTYVRNLTFQHNNSYWSVNENDGYPMEFGYNTAACTNSDFTAISNYCCGGILWIGSFTNLTMVSNVFALGGGHTVYMPQLGPAGTRTWDANEYFITAGSPFETGTNLDLSDFAAHTFTEWTNLTGFDVNSTYHNHRPTSPQVFIRPNLYETNRANITVFNWTTNDNISVDISSILPVGTRYRVKNAAHFLGGDVIRSVYAGGTISLPMTNLTVAPPLVASTPPATGPQFNVFVVLKDTQGLVQASTLRVGTLAMP